MPEKQLFSEQPLPHSVQQCYGNNPHETDEEFLERQFRTSIAALERVSALSPGEFDVLIQQPAHTDEARRQRSAHHHDIARRTLIAAHHNLIREEDFNIWSGRRKENGQPVKFRFERAYANASTPITACKRGALTGIVRAFVRLQDEMMADLIARGEKASSGSDLLAIEREAVKIGLVEFEPYTAETINGWPCYPRSTGRFRGGSRLREFFERRQSELPLLAAEAQSLLEKCNKRSVVEESGATRHEQQDITPDHRKMLSSVKSFFTSVLHLAD